MIETKPRILIVDDERLNINVLAELLKPNYKVMVAINGDQALKAAGGGSPPDLILLDIMMPEMDGHEVCRRLKEAPNTKDIPIIFVTAMGQEEDERKGLDIGAVDYITKPVVGAVVEARVRTHVTLRRNMLELREAYQLIEIQKKRMQGELDVGREIQMGMLPADLSPSRNQGVFTVHGSMKAAREVGGDFYDFFFVDNDHFAVCIGDVSGKGVPAALFMTVSKALIKSRASADRSPASILTHVNEEIATDNESCMFITVFLAILNISSGELRFTNAGHNPPYIRRAEGRIEALNQMHGPVIGALEGLTYGEDCAFLDRNDLLMLYTDGVTEAMNLADELYSDQRLADLLAAAESHEPKVAVQAVMDSVEEFANGADQSDDITLLGLSYEQDHIVEEKPSFRLVIPNKLEEISPVIDQFERFSEEQSIPQRVAQQVMLCLEELLENTISYGFEDGKIHRLEANFELIPDRKLTITLLDDGIPFNPFQMKSADTSTGIDDRGIGGLGIHLVRKTMDEIFYKRLVEKNEVILIKHLNTP
jgi:sigma-B regulation protein RsbU (phosphoserine phosphatase)